MQLMTSMIMCGNECRINGIMAMKVHRQIVVLGRMGMAPTGVCRTKRYLPAASGRVMCFESWEVIEE